MRLLRVRNLDRYQHYRDRTPPWVKLHQETLENYGFGELPDATKYHALAIVLLASRTENSLPDDPAWIGKKINAKSKVDLAALVSAGFLEVYQDASASLAEGLQDAPRAGARSPSPSVSSLSLDFVLPPELDTPPFRLAWERRLKERGALAPSKRPTAEQLEAQLAKLVKLAAARGLDHAAACVERATEAGHQGVVFPEDFNGNGGLNGRAIRQSSRPAHSGSTPERIALLRERDRLALLPDDDVPRSAAG